MIRYDTTKWLTHFIHQENKDLSGDEFFEEILSIIRNGNQNTPFLILKQILTDGYLRCSWSERSGKRTIYGLRPAICFTEMPLGAIAEYVKQRDKKYVSEYGIAFLKEELFRAGARPVIYGLTSDPKEASEGDEFFRDGFRNLSSASGIGPSEQYRYVSTNLGGNLNPIDWTHEREWRWIDNLDWLEDFLIQGLPFSIKRSSYTFSKVIIMVKTSKEKEELTNLLKQLPDQESAAGGQLQHSQVKCEKIKILESSIWEKALSENETVKLEDLEELGYV
ncbi:hypothetical protein [Dyadobacter frigoris]|uniref:Uncharacterized protein n=1 Tax=Dyadobacter frigoris TaxID=2576211 RepID=A0A4U6CQU3_9BACT|nr:hypothetical protein [Dyadobacter frigoris]TKT86516.1 hypothetical protein FDK13_32040 [Dyadobacter frigoris]